MATLPPLALWLRQQEQEGKFKSLRQIAKYAQISPDTIWRIYTGEVSQPTPRVIDKLAVYFGVPRDDLMVLAGYVERPRTLLALGGFAHLEDMTPAELEQYRRDLDTAIREADAVIARRRRGLPDT